MKTIKEIAQALSSTIEPEQWMKELEMDGRAGVQKELARWIRNYDKRKLLQSLHDSKIAFDNHYKPFSSTLLAGVDEAGRGPLAGPVVCAAVILPHDVSMLIGLDDSKQLSKPERERLAKLIKTIAVSYSVHIQPAERIDLINIYAATRESMELAVGNLSTKPDIVLADAMSLIVDCPCESIIKGDAKSLSIAAASILAKTTRDNLMEELDMDFPMYQFKKNAGYGTAVHLEALNTYGPCIHHRKTFEPVKSILGRGVV
ncbi:ribonuclease HII [Sporosarcina sp. Sa2YVA2]|uniref:Ribonuclease HII n=1 Tax=Sporosarcina quadrami TaxID=2762234 RepID=A0ABR8U659_9BACL|nr:ribonuclease HII [Sporosarcina quadrami]MBD7983512.1 ribonuclease HII [Sporosarcina quadrami]